jgi:hypothetical protein
MAKKQERANTRTSLSLAPLSVDEALAALLKTPPPPAGTRKQKPRKGTKRKALKKR